MAQRSDRVAALIREVVSDLIMTRLKDPRIGFASVVRVSVNRDLSQAKVYISVLGTEEEKEKTMEGLKSAQGLIRSEVSKALGIRHAPEIEFILDDSIEYSMHISKLLSEIEEKEKKAEDKKQPE
ncbi:MAG TPA: 30S ribosome-binding factor RbfA [Bacillota bacterium]|nr:30S ribosome-binding factor RbfA [Candidatus Fermentithermobacillaceae bacterium]HOB30572.1 30S ribosome-binding factor RbfA [Bacillota bacterium]HOK64438.1 30S ribosome-binding factor RbfA [Bacillota bacterium]HOL11724.1 30S ribosome-binding factor RbfA [Bacillota bacterium]HOQ02362.1 30S ribosome-binding factor RbfA [Bacillota bacterium]